MRSDGCLALFLIATLASAPRAAADPAATDAAPPLPAVTWRTDLAAALRQAKAENRPLFVSMRCLPCKQCSDFDRDVLEGGPDLDPLLKRFVTVRLTDVEDVDLRLFPMEGFQDFDLSWWGWFLSPEGEAYSVFGGRDHVSDSSRISVKALAATMERVLAHHGRGKRARAGIEAEAPAEPNPGASGDPVTPKDLPGYASWREKAPPEVKAQACIHCHQVAEILRQPRVDEGLFDKSRDFDVWPLPENVGLSLDRDHGLLVTAVEKGSPADRAGMRPADGLDAAGGRPLFSQADFRGVLHRGPRGAGSVDVTWRRGAKVMSGALRVSDGWRKTVLDWRMSVSQGNVGAYPAFWPLPANESDRRRLGLRPRVMAIKPYWGPNPTSPAYAAGLRPGDVITAIDGESPDLAGRALLVWFLMRHEPGETVTLTVRDAKGSERKVTYALPKRGQE